MWSIQDEVNFFKKSLSITDIDRLMYCIKEKYYAFAPKGGSIDNATIQSRNGILGSYTEKWARHFFYNVATENHLKAINGVICPEIGLTSRSSADLAFCTKDGVMQRPEDIKLIFEIKMGIVNNYTYNTLTTEFEYIGDYKTHEGNPSLLRSDSMLKAIGKSINIRLCAKSKHIPIIVLGNSPITDSYTHKVDNLHKNGIVQHFISLYPNPTSTSHIINTPSSGFITPNDERESWNLMNEILNTDFNYFSSMKSDVEIGKIIREANKQPTDELKGQEFLRLLEL